jgi:hypothetical protein
VNLIDVLDFIADCVMAGMARSGSVYPLHLSPELLERAFQNTVALLKSQVTVEEAAQLTLLADGASYRHLACAAIDALAILTKQHDALERVCRDQQDQIRLLMGLDDQTRD